MVRMTEEQHKAVRVRAAELGQPIAEIVRTLLDAWLNGEVEIELPQRGAKKGE